MRNNIMQEVTIEQFNQEIIKFLQSQYDNAHFVDITLRYKNIFTGRTIQFLYNLYKSGLYYPERGEFAWQKELIDIIEGS